MNPAEPMWMLTVYGYSELTLVFLMAALLGATSLTHRHHGHRDLWGRFASATVLTIALLLILLVLVHGLIDDRAIGLEWVLFTH